MNERRFETHPPVMLKDYPSEALETVGCGICKNQTAKNLFHVRGFPIDECNSCSTRFVSRRLKADRLFEMYSDESYYRSPNSVACGYADYLKDKGNIVKTFHRRLDWIQQSVPPGSKGNRLLDIGCAVGYGVECALARGWDANGLEPSLFAATLGQKRLGNRIHHGTLDDHVFQKESFDMILNWDVIEHLTDPSAALVSMNRLLKKGGVLSLITPDSKSTLAALLGKHWMEYSKPTEHIFFFDLIGLSKLLRQTGFQVISTTTAGKYASLDFFFNRLGGYFPFARKLFQKMEKRWGEIPLFYIDPRDKLHILAIKV